CTTFTLQDSKGVRDVW
nr:immunoglobulin heavy chain junction region [Macaca mulatta]MOX01690.1 immunoglobulin heavy chain junction region [Macaca mulatta]MOX05166.1 immunoglobulin heavy chain junction region [Macaca mulatta]